MRLLRACGMRSSARYLIRPFITRCRLSDEADRSRTAVSEMIFSGRMLVAEFLGSLYPSPASCSTVSLAISRAWQRRSMRSHAFHLPYVFGASPDFMTPCHAPPVESPDHSLPGVRSQLPGIRGKFA